MMYILIIFWTLLITNRFRNRMLRDASISYFSLYQLFQKRKVHSVFIIKKVKQNNRTQTIAKENYIQAIFFYGHCIISDIWMTYLHRHGVNQNVQFDN